MLVDIIIGVIGVCIIIASCVIVWRDVRKRHKTQYEDCVDKAKFDIVEAKLKRFIAYRDFDKETFILVLEEYLSYLNSSNPKIFFNENYALPIVNIVVECKIAICINREFHNKTYIEMCDNRSGFYYMGATDKSLESFLDEYIGLYVKRYNFNCYFDENEGEYDGYLGREITKNDFQEALNKEKFFDEMKDIHELVVKYLV